MTEFDFYLMFSFLPGIVRFFREAFILSGSISAISLFCILDKYVRYDTFDAEQLVKKYFSPLKISVTSFIFCWFIICVVPNQKDFAVMYIAPKIINNQDIQKIPGYVLKYIEKEVGR